MADAPAVSPAILAAKDPRRLGRVRHAMHLLIPRVVVREKGDVVRYDKVAVIEQADGVRLAIDIDNDGIGVQSVDLSLPECCDLSNMLNRIRHRVAKRPGYRP